jgi:hypothetical protein
MTDPFLINVSGGRTSALMLRRYLDANGGRLPEHTHAAFCNTGDEHPKTLDFLALIAERWGVNLRWLERDGSAPVRARFREVTYETASRNAEPFRELIAERRYLPNAVARICSAALKVETARDFMRAQGYEHWTSAIGLRWDERARVAKHKEKQEDEHEFDSVYPLHAARIVKADVTEFWQASPFDLGLESWQSNCKTCFLKSASILERTEREEPGSLAWAAEEERVRRATFVKGRRHLTIIERASRPMLRGLVLDPEDAAPIDCSCTERRPAVARSCTCGKRRGEGHALHCARVMGRAA